MTSNLHTICTMKKEKSFLSGALVLSLGGLLAKVLGALYRIPLTNILGSYGMGLYQLVFPPYILFLTVAQAGVPVALSKLIAQSNQLDNKIQGRKYFKFAFGLLLCFGIISALFMAVLSTFIAKAQGNVDTAMAFVVVAPALIFVPITNVLKAYFQGNMNMVPSGVTTVIEQIVKLIVGLSLAVKLMPNVVQAVLGAVFAITVSEFGSLLIMSIVYLSHRKKHRQLSVHLPREELKQTAQQVALIAVPVALGGFAMQLSQVVDSVMVVNLLRVNNATEMYGLWTGPVNSMLGLPIALSSGVAVSALPGITQRYYASDNSVLQKGYNSALKLTLVIALPCALGMIALSRPILELLYGSLPENEIYISSILLSLSGMSIVFLAITQTAISVCQAVGKPYATVVIVSLSIVVKAVCNLILLPNQNINIFGAAISETMCYLFAAVCVIIYLRKKIGLKVDVTASLVKPVSCAMVMTLFITLCVAFWQRLFASKLGTLALIGLAGIAYFCALLLLGVFDSSELRRAKSKI